MNYAQVLVWNSSSKKMGPLTYSYENADLKVGDWVKVSFRNKESGGVVWSLGGSKPDFKVRNIAEKVDKSPLRAWQIKLAQFLSEHYFCSIYDALNTIHTDAQALQRKKRQKSEKITDNPPHLLSGKQSEIIEDWLKKRPELSLLWGVTGSGKTEIYRHLLAQRIKEGYQGLLLLPEISLTPNFLHYFQSQFPRLAVWHSRMSPAQKKQLALQVETGEIQLLIGSRSALFAPFKNLGLILMDEEHEGSYKQDQAPRYHARTVALKLGEILKIPVMLGSATPSLESLELIRERSAPLYRIQERASDVPLPKITVVDMRIELQKGHKNMLSDELEQKMRSTMARGDQVMLFLNRRGSAAVTLCRDCGHVPECPHCERPLVHHARNFRNPLLLCHHCNFSMLPPSVCSNCKSVRIRQIGLGTERLEEEIQKINPEVRILRMDQDSTQKKKDWETLLKKIRSGQFDVLIGTQMITKGWDLPKVTLMGIVLADLGMHIPDFRGQERHFQQLVQAAGRPGRREVQGEVIVQTYNPENVGIQALAHDGIDEFYREERANRLQAGLPPFGKIIKLGLQAQEWKAGIRTLEAMEGLLNKLIEQEKLRLKISSAPALFPKRKGYYHWNLLIEGENPADLLKSLPAEALDDWKIDVDPQETV